MALALSLALIAEPRIEGTPIMSIARAMNSPSRDMEIIARVGFCFSTRRQISDSAMRPCQKAPITPSGPATAASAPSVLTSRQRMVAWTISI